MFSFNFLVVDDEKAMANISAAEFDCEYETLYGEVDVRIGTFHWTPSPSVAAPGEIPQGSEILDCWIGAFANVLSALYRGETYAAFHQVDTIRTWFVFEREGENVIISVAEDTGIVLEGMQYVHTRNTNWDPIYSEQPLPYLRKVERQTCSVTLERFGDIVEGTITHFLAEMYRINPRLKDSKLYHTLARKRTHIKGQRG